MKEEHVFLIRMSVIQRKLYNEFMTALQASGIGAWASSNNPIKAFSVCCKVGTAGSDILIHMFFVTRNCLYCSAMICNLICLLPVRM